MEEFLFDYHTPTTSYPDNGLRGTLGNSYTFTVKPVAPPQRTLTLNFEQMTIFGNADGSPDYTTQVAINFNALEKFYQEHQLWRTFLYRHPIYGMLRVRFDEPLTTPKSKNGYTEAFSVKLQEQP